MTIKFEVQRREQKDGRSNLFIRVRDGRNFDQSIQVGIKIFSKYWNAKKGLLDKQHPDAASINENIIEWNAKIQTALNLSVAGKSRDEVLSVFKYKNDIKFIEDFIKEVLEPKRNLSISDRQLTNQITAYNRFKDIVGIKRKLEWQDINESLYEKYYAAYEPKLRDREISRRTYKNYAAAPIWMLHRAVDEKLFRKADLPHISTKYKSPKTEGKKRSKTAIDKREMANAITLANTIERWESCAIWMLEFGLRGIGNSDIIRLTEDIARDNRDRPVARNLDAIAGGNIYFDYGRSKNGAPMFIRLFPSVAIVLEKLKYAMIYTHAEKKIRNQHIVAGMSDRYSILKYDSKRNTQKHQDLFGKRTKLFREMGLNIDFASARRTFEQTAKMTTNFNTGLCKILIGETNDAMLRDHYENYKSLVEIGRVESAHHAVLVEFEYDWLVSLLVAQLQKIIEETNAPRWILKQSGVHRNKSEYKVLVGFTEGSNPDWETIPPQYHKFFNDPTMDTDYWDNSEELPKTPRERDEENLRRYMKAEKWLEDIKRQQQHIDAVVENQKE
ncbi:MAG: Arm DNA-binding domain-containing protein [Flavobacteriales bacterium]